MWSGTEVCTGFRWHWLLPVSFSCLGTVSCLILWGPPLAVKFLRLSGSVMTLTILSQVLGETFSLGLHCHVSKPEQWALGKRTKEETPPSCPITSGAYIIDGWPLQGPETFQVNASSPPLPSGPQGSLGISGILSQFKLSTQRVPNPFSPHSSAYLISLKRVQWDWDSAACLTQSEATSPREIPPSTH